MINFYQIFIKQIFIKHLIKYCLNLSYEILFKDFIWIYNWITFVWTYEQRIRLFLYFNYMKHLTRYLFFVNTKYYWNMSVKDKFFLCF